MAQGIICEYCGSQNDPRSTNCSKCGAPLPAAPPPPPPPPPQYQQPQYQPLQPFVQQRPVAPPYPAAVPRKNALGCFTAVGCFVVAMLVILFIVAMFAGNTTTTTPSRTHATTAPGAARTALALSGSGDTTTAPFPIGYRWDLAWSYNCSNLGRAAAFKLSVRKVDGSAAKVPEVVRHGTRGTETQHYYLGGLYRLAVTSRCHWTVKAINLN